MPTCISEPATLAAGPDSIVIAGRCRISLMSITPPSPRMIISGASMPAFFMLVSVRLAVAIIRGRIDALMTAVRVLVVSPYSLVTSCPHVVGRPNSSPTARTSSSVDVLSTPNAAEATSTWAPAARSARTAFSTALRSRPSLSRNWLQVCSTRPVRVRSVRCEPAPRRVSRPWRPTVPKFRPGPRRLPTARWWLGSCCGRAGRHRRHRFRHRPTRARTPG